jgi:hypothetical protein
MMVAAKNFPTRSKGLISVGPYEIAGILNALLIAANFMVTSLRTRLLF